MAKNWFAKAYLTGELNSTTCIQPFKTNSNVALLAIRIWVVVYGNPVLSGLRANIYSNRGSAPAGLIMTSTNSWATSEITSEDNAAREIYFTFTPRQLLSTETYYVSLSADSYTGTDASHIAWVHSILDPLYTVTGAKSTRVAAHVAVYPQYLSLVGASVV